MRANRSFPFLTVASTALLAIAFTLSSVVASDSSRSKAPRHPPAADSSSQGAPREIDFPYYSLRDGYSSLLQLVSDSPVTLPIAVTIRSSSGRTVLAQQLIIHSQEKLRIDLRSFLANLGAESHDDFQEGSISVSYASETRPIMGQITVTNPRLGLVFESRLAINDPGDSNIPAALEGLWWGLATGRQAKVMVANTSNSSVTADVSLTFGGQHYPSASIIFEPYETKVLSIRELLAKLNTETEHLSEGGITIVGRSPSPVLIATGMTADRESGFSTTMHFPPAGTPRTSTLFAPGVPISTPSADSPLALAGTFTPHVVVRNLSSSPQTATVTIEYPGTSGSQSITLDPLKLGPYATTDFALDGNSLDKLPLPLPYCSIQVQYSGQPGSAIVEVSSVERNQNFVVDSKLGDPSDRLSGSGINPWHLDEQTESVLFLTNEGDAPARVAFQIQAQGVRYHLTNLKINAHETRAIDVRKLRDAQKPDLFGNKIPANATDGTLFWVKMDKVPMIGRTLVFSLRNGISSNFDCGCTYHCPIGYYALGVTPPSANVAIGSSQQFKATETWEDCSGLPYFYDVTNASLWSSGSACSVSSTGNATGVAAGSATITATFSDYKYRYSVADGSCTDISRTLPASGTANVPPPTVTFDSFTPRPIPNFTSANVQVTVNPSATINLAISSSGTGAAKFSNLATSMDITQSTTVSIRGTAFSQANAADLTLTASYQSTVLATIKFSVTTGACIGANTAHGGTALQQCPFSVSVYDTYDIGQFCNTCQFTCTPIFTAGDTSFTPSDCSSVYGGVAGASDQVLMSTQTGNFAPNNCNVHNLQIKTLVRNWDGSITTSYTGGTFALKCDANGSPACP